MEAARVAPILLIVEDDVLSAIALRDALEDAGYMVMDLTERHDQALSAVRLRKPDLALVNIELQGHDDGIELARELKEIGVPVLFISGQSNRARSARSVAVASLPKPYSAADMVHAVDYLLRHLKGAPATVAPRHLELFDEAPTLEADPA